MNIRDPTSLVIARVQQQLRHFLEEMNMDDHLFHLVYQTSLANTSQSEPGPFEESCAQLTKYTQRLLRSGWANIQTHTAAGTKQEITAIEEICTSASFAPAWLEQFFPGYPDSNHQVPLSSCREPRKICANGVGRSAWYTN